MTIQWLYLLLSLSFLLRSVSSNRAHPPQKVIKLALAASKASYMPAWLNGNLYPISSAIKENSETIPKLPTVVLGTLADMMKKPNVFSLLPKQIYNILFDKQACSVVFWGAAAHASGESQVIKLSNIFEKVVAFGFRGSAEYSVKDMEKNFMASLHWLKVGTKEFSVHKPFFDQYNAIAGWFENEYKKVPHDYTVILTGYDTGGPLAFIAALMVTLKFHRRPDAVVVFGSPTVGGLEFNYQYRTHVGCDRTLSIVVMQDIFTRFPVGAIRPCEDTTVDGGKRYVDPITAGMKELFIKSFPEVVPLIIDNFIGKGRKNVINQLLPPQQRKKMLAKAVVDADKMFEMILDFESWHHLYFGYMHGIEKAYKGQAIDFGCNRKL